MAGRNIRFACHRIVHGGSFPKAVILSPDTIHHLDELSDLAPLYVHDSIHFNLL
jgi:acetate kinase